MGRRGAMFASFAPYLCLHCHYKPAMALGEFCLLVRRSVWCSRWASKVIGRFLLCWMKLSVSPEPPQPWRLSNKYLESQGKQVPFLQNTVQKWEKYTRRITTGCLVKPTRIDSSTWISGCRFLHLCWTCGSADSTFSTAWPRGDRSQGSRSASAGLASSLVSSGHSCWGYLKDYYSQLFTRSCWEPV